MIYSLHQKTQEIEEKIAEQQRHMDWYAQECQTGVATEDRAHYKEEYHSLMRLHRQITQLKDQKGSEKQRNRLTKAYFQLQGSIQQARRTLLTLGSDMNTV
eukprot:INCI1566.2.p1 GENE.INCI1566.2~~INCI1566.2.p1  ORF type:complete len:101 (-),score=18.84 INCI1566.2:187-489(-)